MGGVLSVNSVITGDVTWYLSGGLSDAERLSHARATNAAIVRGTNGFKAGAKLRSAGFEGRLWLDPATYDRPEEPRAETLFGDHWQLLQDELGVAQLISPGTYVGRSDFDALGSALDVEGAWVARAGGRLSLALHASWLTHGLDGLIGRLEQVEAPLALAFADPNDPLGHAGAVQGLVDMLGSVGDAAILRCDLGALGAVAHGASLGAIGTSSTMRHVVPPGQKGGGVPLDKSPSVFVSELLDFKLGSHLDEFPREASPTCELACCRGRALRRFNGEHAIAEARTHNRIAIGDASRKILETAPDLRPGVFTNMCIKAEYAVAALSVAARRPMKVRPQVKAWARLG